MPPQPRRVAARSRRTVLALLVAIAALAAVPSPAPATPIRFSETTGSTYARSRPSSIHGGSDFGWTGITWSSWGGTHARGAGSYYYVDKSVTPFDRVLFPATFTLSRIRWCGRSRLYTRMTVAFTGVAPEGTGSSYHLDYRCGIVIALTDDYESDLVKPRSIILATGDGNARILHARWRRWGLPTATARATLAVNDCKPYCARGRLIKHAVTVTASDAGVCRSISGLAYRRLTARYVARPHRVAYVVRMRRYPCGRG